MSSLDLRGRIHQWLGLPYKLHIEEEGSGPVIIMIHGIAASSMSWDNLKPQLHSNYRCITIDLLGFGLSPKPERYSYSPKEHVASIRYTIKKLKLKEPYILMGHSLGALLALHYANKYNKEVERLFLVSPPVYFTHPEIKRTLRVWHHALYSRAYRYIRNNKDLTIKGAERLRKTTRRKILFDLSEETWLPFSKSLEECIEKQNVIADLKHVSCPIDIFYGSLDQLLIKANLRHLSKFNGVTLHRSRAGHIISKRYAEAIAKALIPATKEKATLVQK